MALWTRRRTGADLTGLIHHSVDDLELATLSWVHWFNTDRLHSSIGNVPPVEYEHQHYRQIAALTEDQAALASLH